MHIIPAHLNVLPLLFLVQLSDPTAVIAKGVLLSPTAQAFSTHSLSLSHGAEQELFYYSDWIRKPGVAICSCNDGLRPVIFKLEATDEVSQIDYIPVR